MKIFDFTNGTKGKLLGEVRLSNYSRGWFSDIGMVGSLQGMEFCNDGGYDVFGEAPSSYYTFSKLLERFDTKAICFCLGKWGAGTQPKEWVWNYHCSAEYARSLGATISPIPE